MAAIPVPSDQTPANPPRPLASDPTADLERRTATLERAGNQSIEERLAALEAAVFP